MGISREVFGTLPGGRTVELFTLTSPTGLTAKITNYGGRITSIHTPDSDGKFGEVTLGYDTLTPYLTDPYYLGATIGRNANRIGGASFEHDGVKHHLTRNEGCNHLHGGDGFETKLWIAEIEQETLILRYSSPNGEAGYPGNMDVMLRITWGSVIDLQMDYSATTDTPCPVNLTNHAYFNLGHEVDIRDHTALVNANSYLPSNEEGIPTGEYKDVQASALDLRSGAIIGYRFNRCALPQGYDHSYEIGGKGLREAATVSAPGTGRSVTLLTTQPGLQFYTGVGLKGGLGRDGEIWPEFAGLCLEGQHHPDSPNHTHFPSTMLRPDEIYHQTQIYRFETS